MGVASPRRLAQLAARAAIATTLLCWPALSISAHAERRVALVIGNAAYTDAGRLANPRNAAQDLGAALSRLGFDVTVEADVGSLQFEQTVAGFVAKARGADVALF